MMRKFKSLKHEVDNSLYLAPMWLDLVHTFTSHFRGLLHQVSLFLSIHHNLEICPERSMTLVHLESWWELEACMFFKVKGGLHT
jgi:hypothetical protein